MSINKKPIAYGGIIKGSLYEPSNNPNETYNAREFFSDTTEIRDADAVQLSVSVKKLYSVLEDK